MKKDIFTVLLSLVILVLFSSCRNNVTDPVNDQIIEEKVYVYSLKQIKEPSERVHWKPGEIHEIRWEITENLENVRITLLRKYREVDVISESTENDGRYDWIIPSDLLGSHHYRIRISALNNISANSTSVEFEIHDNSFGPQEDE